ncbi:hypothetical protein N9I08_04455 [Candidatus Pelagibacter sp.]|jgi:tetratricopeptide (TPR) repeat protein|nr:hypothetical protein [Candidatus Pelagibacter sp.]
MNLNLKDILLLVKDRKFNESIEHLDKLIQVDKNNFDYYYLKGISYLSLDELENAIENFSLAINIKDNSFIVYHYRGIAYLNLAKFSEAKKDFYKLISLKTDFPEVYNNLAILFYMTGNNEESIENFLQSIKLDKNHKQAISGLINALSHTENIKINDSEIISTHNKINDINFYYSSNKNIDNEDIKEFLKKANDIIDNNHKNLEFDMTQIFRRDKVVLNCKRHKKIFNTYSAIPEYCFGCYKVQVDLDNVVDLIKLYIIFENINLKNNNLRKCMIEFRKNITGKYKGLIYCDSLIDSEYVKNHLIVLLDKNFNKKLLCKIKRGCTEYAMKYSEYDNLTNNAMTYKSEWKKYENLIDKRYPDLTIKKKLRPTIKGISLNDVLIIRNWLAYARMIGDESHTIITDQIYNSNFIEKKLKYRI